MRHLTGSIEVITGSMFSGKTDELIRRLRRAHIARQKIQVFKPAIDNRYAVEKVTSHAGSEFDAVPAASAEAVAMLIEPDTTVVAIDEAQFFDWHIAEVCQGLAARGKLPTLGVQKTHAQRRCQFSHRPLAAPQGVQDL